MIMFKFIKQAFIVLLSLSVSLARVAKISGSTKCISLNNELCIARPTLIGLNLEEFHYNHPLMVTLGRYNGSCNTIDDLSSRICV